jgi:hypothetical protein
MSGMPSAFRMKFGYLGFRHQHSESLKRPFLGGRPGPLPCSGECWAGFIRELSLEMCSPRRWTLDGFSEGTCSSATLGLDSGPGSGPAAPLQAGRSQNRPPDSQLTGRPDTGLAAGCAPFISVAPCTDSHAKHTPMCPNRLVRLHSVKLFYRARIFILAIVEDVRWRT